jgi:HAE1 family hydrophobic/amphiphilic exporter-1
LERGREEVQIVLDRDRARSYGISPQSVGRVLSIVLRGRELGGYRASEGEVDIWIRLRPGDREDLADLKSMVVGVGRDGQEIILSQVADFEVKKTPGSIQRENRRTYTSLYANYSGGKKDDGKKVVTAVMEGLSFPPGYGWSYGFWTQREEQEDRDFMFNLLLALFMVYFVMASLFESLSHPFAIMLSLLFAFVGVAWFLFVTGTPFNLMAMIGLMILVGIVVNNGIVLLDHVNNLRRRGLPRSEAILAGCRERLRPILMTASTTIVGLIPLATGHASLMNLRYFPMARTVMGGLMASTILTLVVLPTYYTLVDDVTLWLRRTWHGSSQGVLGAKVEEPGALPSSAPVAD